MRIDKFYISWVLFFLCIYALLLCRDLFVTIYLYINRNIFYIDFSFREAFYTTLIICVPCFILHLILYKYGSSKYRK